MKSEPDQGICAESPPSPQGPRERRLWALPGQTSSPLGTRARWRSPSSRAGMGRVPVYAQVRLRMPCRGVNSIVGTRLCRCMKRTPWDVSGAPGAMSSPANQASTSQGVSPGQTCTLSGQGAAGAVSPRTGVRPVRIPARLVCAGRGCFKPRARLEINESPGQTGCCSGWPGGCAEPGGAQAYVRRERGFMGVYLRIHPGDPAGSRPSL